MIGIGNILILTHQYCMQWRLAALSGCPLAGGQWHDDRIPDRSQLRGLGALFCNLHRACVIFFGGMT